MVRIVETKKSRKTNCISYICVCISHPFISYFDLYICLLERLVFDWSSGLQIQDKKKKILKTFKSEAMMYDLVMCLICEGIGKAGVATETSMAGEFAAANREYAAAAGIFEFLANDHLPKWKSRGAQVDDNDLPVECNIEVAKGLQMLFKANGQQMAVTTVLIKPGTPNYSLLAKLCLGVQEQLEQFIMHMRDNAFRQMSRIEKDFFTLIAFQTQLYKGLTYYFHARSLWEAGEYGLAIAMLSDATVTVRTRTTEVSEGLPDVAKVQALLPLIRDLEDLRKHLAFLLKTWEKDNSECYFDVVPTSVPLEKKLEKGVQIGKSEAYRIKDPEPLLLSLPEDALKRSDSDLARELQEKFDAELKD